jgi:hypothetical protein
MAIYTLDETGIKYFSMEGMTVWGHINGSGAILNGSDLTADIVGK